MHIELPKWPALLVAGDKVTVKQAAEILLKTQLNFPDVSYGTNDRAFTAGCRAIFGIPEEPTYPKDGSDKVQKKYHAARNAIFDGVTALRAELGILSLRYLQNSQIFSNWIGGPHGWCSWDGRIQACNYNIGKWPSVDEVLADWEEIAAAFPFLKLKCQLCNHEAGYLSYDRINGPVVLFEVSRGKVTVQPQTPGKDLYITSSESCSSRLLGSELGSTLAELKSKIELVYGKKHPMYTAQKKKRKKS